MISYIPEAWLEALNCQPSWIDKPDDYAAMLSDRAMDLHRRRQVDADTLSDMLEMVEAGRWYILGEIEEAYTLVGLFGYFPEECEWGTLVKVGEGEAVGRTPGRDTSEAWGKFGALDVPTVDGDR